MSVFSYTLLLLLALGPIVKHLHAHQTATDFIKQTTVAMLSPFFNVSEGVTTEDAVVHDPQLGVTNDDDSPTTPISPTTREVTDNPSLMNKNKTSSEVHTAASDGTTVNEDVTSSENPTAASEGETTMSDQKPSTVLSSSTPFKPRSTMMIDTELTSKQNETTTDFTSSESTALFTEKTTEILQRSSISPAFAPKASESISTSPYYTKQPEISTHTPARSTHPRSLIKSTTTTSTTSTQVQTTLAPEHHTTDSTVISTINDTVQTDSKPLEVESEKPKNDFKWLTISVIVLVIFCVLTTFCIGIVIRRKRNSGKQQFGPMNGRSKKKKGGEDDVWAGPVKLGGVEKEDGNCPEEALLEGADKPDGSEVMLSTFVAPEEKAGVGRPGSKEVKKWEMQEPLLYIDEETKGVANEKETDQKKDEGASESGKGETKEANQNGGETDTKEAIQNGGETFCLTSAV